MEIHYNQAADDHNYRNQKLSVQQEAEKLEALEEIKTSDFSMYDAQDINYLAAKANITPNEARKLNQKHSDFPYDMIETFVDDETDSIWDYFG